MSGRQDVVECTFVKSDVTDAPYFSTPCRLGKNGIEENLGMGQLSDYEKAKLEEVRTITEVYTHPFLPPSQQVWHYFYPTPHNVFVYTFKIIIP